VGTAEKMWVQCGYILASEKAKPSIEVILLRVVEVPSRIELLYLVLQTNA
jgi:hypothetical protein